MTQNQIALLVLAPAIAVMAVVLNRQGAIGPVGAGIAIVLALGVGGFLLLNW